MKKVINILIAIWMFFMSPFYASMPLKLLARIPGLEIARNSGITGSAVLISIGFLIAFLKQTKTGKLAVIIMLGVTVFFVSKILFNMARNQVSPITNEPYPMKAYISSSIILLINIPLIIWQALKLKEVDSGDEAGN